MNLVDTFTAELLCFYSLFVQWKGIIQWLMPLLMSATILTIPL